LAGEEAGVELDLDTDELWPAAKSLVGLQFANEEDFQRCRALLWEHLDCSAGMDAEERYVVVRRSCEHYFALAGLNYTTVEFTDPETLSPAERYRLVGHLTW
jgi:hypothetical protein